MAYKMKAWARDESGNAKQLLMETVAEKVMCQISDNPPQWIPLDEVINDHAEEIESKAPASHKHAAGDITSGTLPIARGGTGATSASAALTALGAAASSHTHAASSITSGTFPDSYTIAGNLTLKGSGNYGNKLNFGDGDYVHLYEISDDKLEIKATNFSFLSGSTSIATASSSGFAFSGTPTAPTASADTNTTQIATTAFVQTAVSNSGGGSSIPTGTITTSTSIAIGDSSSAGDGSTALGYYANAVGGNSIALGRGANASSLRSAALGHNANTSGVFSTALGFNASASSDFSTALGCNASVSGLRSTALGFAAITSSSDTNTIQLGNASNLAVLRCKVALSVTSDERDKADIVEIRSGLDFINKVKAIQYVSNPRVNYEEIAEIDPDDLREINDIDVEDDVTITELTAEIGQLETMIAETEAAVASAEGEEAQALIIQNGELLKTFREGAAKLSTKRRLLERYGIEKLRHIKHCEHTKREYGLSDYDKDAHAAGLKKGERKRVGVSAQQVTEALKEVYGTADYANIVNDNLHDLDSVPDGVESQLTVTYAGFVPFLIQAVQELSDKVSMLEAKLNEK